ncbi:MAG: F0F1 ATP synthase subunit alpha [bacterium]|nr:F0F1 ATP synthase subunit alpha [bacterium]
MNYDIVEKLKRDIGGRKDEVGFEAVGKVVETSDGIARISGLSGVQSQGLILIETADGDVPALVLNLEQGFIGAIVLGESDKVKTGDKVKSTGKVLSLKVGEEMVGRVVDALGEPIDGKGAIFKDPSKATVYELERGAPSVLARESVGTPLHTGVKSVDAMIPIGRGQRELIIGDRQTGKTAIALDTIINQGKEAGRVVCIYVAIGQKSSKLAKIVKMLEDNGAMKYTIVVAASASDPASMQYLAPYAGCAIGEYFRDDGQDALVVYDDLSKHADAYRQLSLLLRRPPGREAYPGDVFYLHARLLERAAKMSKANGGGSLTALPIIETKLGDVSAYVPTNVISITDGQIYLEASLFFKGVRPAINVGLSVSRVGSAAQTKAMKKVAGKLRLDLAQFRELQAFLQFASDLDEATKQKIRRGELLTEMLKQIDGAPMSFDKQVIVLYAALNGFLDDMPATEVKSFEKGFVDYMESLHADVMDSIRKTRAIDEAAEKNLRAFIEDFKNLKK